MKNPVDEAEILLQTFPGLLAGRCPGWQDSLLAEALLRWTTRWRSGAPPLSAAGPLGAEETAEGTHLKEAWSLKRQGHTPRT